MKTSTITSFCLDDIEKVVNNQISFGNVYIDTQNQNKWYCPLTVDVAYIPEQNFLYHDILLVHNHGFRAYLADDSILIDEQRAHLKDSIRSYIIMLHTEITKLFTEGHISPYMQDEDTDFEPIVISNSIVEPMVQLITSGIHEHFNGFFEPGCKEEENPWLLLCDIAYTDNLTIDNIPGQLELYLHRNSDSLVSLDLLFLEDESHDGLRRKWSMVIEYHNGSGDVTFCVDPPVIPVFNSRDTEDSGEQILRILRKQMWSMMDVTKKQTIRSYCQAIIPQPANYPNMVDDLRHYVAKNAHDLSMCITVREITIPSNVGPQAAALIVGPKEAISELLDD